MIYTKPINAISFNDIIDFLDNNNPEGFILEYKREIPTNEKIAKILAAFANTYGGILLIGVDAPKGVPQQPFKGIDIDSSLKYEEKIQSIILSNIKEPIFPEIKLCLNEKNNDKGFLIIRVSESHLTPHRVGNDRKIYIRTGEFSKPNEEASWDKILWLSERRKKSEELKNYLINESEISFIERFKNLGIDVNSKEYFGLLSLRILPLFPQNPLIKYYKLMDFDETLNLVSAIKFPFIPYGFKPVQNGVQKLFINSENHKKPRQGEPFKYLYLNSFGLYLYKADIGRIDTRKTSNTQIKIKKIYPTEILEILFLFMNSAREFFKTLGYWGSLDLEIELKNVLGITIPQNKILINDLVINRNNLKWQRKFTMLELNEFILHITSDVAHDIYWSLGETDNDKDKLESYIKSTVIKQLQ